MEEGFERKSTKEQIITLRKKSPTISAAAMARELDVSRQAIGDHLKRLGLTTSFYKLPTCKTCGVSVQRSAKQCLGCRDKKRESLRITVFCGTCKAKKEILKSEIRYRQRAKRYTGETWYCDKTCFYDRKKGI